MSRRSTSEDTGGLWVVRRRCTGHLSSDRDEHPVVYGPASKAACDQVADNADAYNDLGATTWHYVTEA